MSRATSLALFIILVQASIGFVDASGLFSAHYLDTPQNNANYQLEDLKAYSAQTDDPGLWDDAKTLARWSIDAFLIGIKIVFAVAFIFPTLVKDLGVPAILSAFLQVGVYFVYATWYAQYRSGKGWKQYE